MAVASAIATRRKTAVESFKTAADCIGTIEPGASLFAITRGQFSMIDAALACLEQAGPSDLSIWTWTVAEYEIECMERLRIADGSNALMHEAADEIDRLLQAHRDISTHLVRLGATEFGTVEEGIDQLAVTYGAGLGEARAAIAKATGESE